MIISYAQNGACFLDEGSITKLNETLKLYEFPSLRETSAAYLEGALCFDLPARILEWL